MTKNFKPGQTQDAAIAAMTSGALLGIAMANQAFGLWMSAAVGMVEAFQGAAVSDRSQRGAEAPVHPAAPPSPADATDFFSGKVAESNGHSARNVVPLHKPRLTSPRGRDTVAARSAPTPVVAPIADRADDLKAISGIGPKLEQVLNGAGIRTYLQLAALSADEVTALENRFGLEGRIGRDDWQSQAVALVAGYAADGSEIGRQRRAAPQGTGLNG